MILAATAIVIAWPAVRELEARLPDYNPDPELNTAGNAC
jgi:hypothetical protein